MSVRELCYVIQEHQAYILDEWDASDTEVYLWSIECKHYLRDWFYWNYFCLFSIVPLKAKSVKYPNNIIQEKLCRLVQLLAWKQSVVMFTRTMLHADLTVLLIIKAWFSFNFLINSKKIPNLVLISVEVKQKLFNKGFYVFIMHSE